MNNYYITYQEDLYEIFFEISHEEFREKELFYTQYKKHLDNLDDAQVLKVRVDYIEALFFQGKYKKLLNEIERDLYFVIDKNIHNFGGKDIYQWFLMIKGASHFNIQEYDHSIYVFQQVSRISKKNLKAKKYLFLSLIQKKSEFFSRLNLVFAITFGLCILVSLFGLIIQSTIGYSLSAFFDVRNIVIFILLVSFSLSVGYKYLSNYFVMLNMIQKKR